MFNLDEQTVDQVLTEFVTGLDWAEPVRLVYEYGDRDSLHLWAISQAFEGLDQKERGDLIWPRFRSLPAALLVRVTVFFTLTPDEFEAEYGSELPEGVHDIQRAA